MLLTHRYQAYVENNLIGSNPIGLIVALYEGAIDAVKQAQRCFETGDIWGRGNEVSKAVNILTELIISLNHEKGGELSLNLKRLYAYIQTRLLEGHANKSVGAFQESEKLLSNLLEAWRVVATKAAATIPESQEEYFPKMSPPAMEEIPGPLYGGYLYEPGEVFSRVAVTF